jgi:lipoyl synthase
VTPDEFTALAAVGQGKGFLLVASSPLTRSSHHAAADFRKLRAVRESVVRASTIV